MALAGLRAYQDCLEHQDHEANKGNQESLGHRATPELQVSKQSSAPTRSMVIWSGATLVTRTGRCLCRFVG